MEQTNHLSLFDCVIMDVLESARTVDELMSFTAMMQHKLDFLQGQLMQKKWSAKSPDEHKKNFSTEKGE